MAQRKTPPSGKSGSAKRPSGSGAPRSAKSSSAEDRRTNRPPAKKTTAPGKKPGKSIVNQRQTPWALIITAIAIVAFAGAVVGVVVATHDSSGDSGGNVSKGGQPVNKADPYRQPALPAAMAIKGVTYRVEGEHSHVEGKIKYDVTPPIGGNHSQYWADCTGTVYDKPIANANAVHMLEHGAIWITYNANQVKGAQLTKLKQDVAGVDRMALSPYPNLATPISLQAWGYQLKLNDANDPRIAKFISALKYNPKTTPEPGATCSQPTFKEHPSTFGHPLWVPADGESGGTMP